MTEEKEKDDFYIALVIVLVFTIPVIVVIFGVSYFTKEEMGVMNKTITILSFDVTLTDLKEKAKDENQKEITIIAFIYNRDNNFADTDTIQYILITSENKSYESVYKPSKLLAPKTYTNGDILFTIPTNERPMVLYIKVSGIYKTVLLMKD